MKKTKRKYYMPESFVATSKKVKQWVETVSWLMTGAVNSTFSGIAE